MVLDTWWVGTPIERKKLPEFRADTSTDKNWSKVILTNKGIDGDPVTKILMALERFRPQEASVAVANAILFISMQDFKGAVDYIDREALPRFPSSAMLKAFKGMALLRMDRVSDARLPLEEAARDVADPAAAQLAKDLLT